MLNVHNAVQCRPAAVTKASNKFYSATSLTLVVRRTARSLDCLRSGVSFGAGTSAGLLSSTGADASSSFTLQPHTTNNKQQTYLRFGELHYGATCSNHP